ncbi:hypothetical protein [Streptomyces uncialis]|uniref:Uncharacterized protein n=2 Tax=Streptomyces uncialis TaxID=1048205 RepID=A0A1Q4VDM9_9ACTN|nr:hypothetical protein [Streptomyces uncialis]OKH95948.1 hypothetical protein AB852_04430 [Streptomyces uncialis]WST68788.1 hypothetical protein OG268_15535 [Streptomyces uncialis]WTE12583.1 hypothetical protein OG924_21425 [Streptomyces uncialis]
MYTICLNVSRALVALFLIGGIVVVVGQTVAMAVGSAAMMTSFGSDVADIVCVLAGLAGLFSFLLLYTAEGKEKAGEWEE